MHKAFVGCVYLNNRNGWAKAYGFYAFAETNYKTGNVAQPAFAGDWAGDPISKN